MYNFILMNDLNYPVEWMCRSMKVSKNAYYNWRRHQDIVFMSSPTSKLKSRIKVIL